MIELDVYYAPPVSGDARERERYIGHIHTDALGLYNT